MDLVLDVTDDGNLPQLWMNDPEQGWQVRELPLLFDLQQLTDLDQDGDVDLWGYSFQTLNALLLFNDGTGALLPPQSPQAKVKGYFVLTTVHPPPPETKVPLVWWPSPIGTQGIVVTYERTTGETVSELLEATVGMDPNQVIQAGDFDQDGDVDLITVSEGPLWDTLDGFPAFGINIMRNNGGGRFETVFAMDDVRYNKEFQVVDVNGDGRVDLIVVHNDIHNPAVLVLVQKDDGRFEQEGRYPLSEGRGGPTLGGDLDGDGDIDLVVFDSFVAEGGGVHVLLNRLADGITAVAETPQVVPKQHHLGAAYPNPFNPGVVIPFTVGTSGAPVTLTIYNTLGQEVRKLEIGKLPAGPHQVLWDGLGESGAALSSGVYLYRLQAGAWGAAGKLVKSE